MQLPLAHLDASVIEEIPIELWRRLFDAVGWPASLISVRDTMQYAEIMSAMERDSPSDELLEALEALHSLGTDAGRDAIMAALSDRRVDATALPEASGEREFALHLFLGQRSSAALAEVFARAQTQVEEGTDRRRYHEFLGKEPRAVISLHAKPEALHEHVLKFCRHNDLGDHVNVRAFTDDGNHVFHVIRSHHVRKPLAVVKGHNARATIEYRPVHSDIIRYEPATGCLRVTARAATVVDFYRRALGRVLFDDEAFFSAVSLCSLKPLQDRGRAALESHGVAGIGRVWMTECVWERGDRDVLNIRSTDCFRNMEELRLPLSEGMIVQAKLKVEVVGKSTRPVTVTIRTARSSVELSQQIHEELIDELLAKIGIRNGDNSPWRMDLWSLYPWRHSVGVWRAIFGNQTDVFVANRVLEPVQLHAVAIPGESAGERVLEAHSVGAEFYGVSKVPEIPSRSLTPTDLDGLELKPDQFRIYLRQTLQASGAEVPWDGGALLDIGVIEIDGARIHCTYALRTPPSDTGSIVRARAYGSHVVLLLPSSRVAAVDLATLMIDDPLPSREGVLRAAISKLGLESKVPAVHYAPNGARLVVDTKHGKVWVDGVEITDLRQGTQPFRFVEMLARESPSPVSSYALTDALSGGRQDGDTSARQAKNAARKAIAKAITVARAGKQVPDDFFPTQAGSYRCIIRSHVV